MVPSASTVLRRRWLGRENEVRQGSRWLMRVDALTRCRVKVGINKLTGERVALKIIQKSGLVQQKAFQQVVAEIAAMKELKHPNIVELKGRRRGRRLPEECPERCRCPA